MLELITNRGDLRNELFEMIRCFVPDMQNSRLKVNFTYVKAACIQFYIVIDGNNYCYSFPLCAQQDRTAYVRYDVYTCKTAAYRAFSAHFGVSLPWGCLTGIRPTRLAVRLAENGVPRDRIAACLHNDYYVSMPKATLAAEILEVQRKHMGDRLSVASDPLSGAGDLVNLYVHIPFCPTRCAYCSFVSEGIEKQQWMLLPYTEALIEEIVRTKALIAAQNKRIFSVYVGGGTPTVLSADLLRKVLGVAAVDDVEYTCEAGRPDTITADKLQVMNDCGVNRVSINPQTLHDKTLQRIGRAHTAERFFAAYDQAAAFGFVKNVDLIAGLEGEREEDFAYTLQGILRLAPENITVHTLCRKRGSAAAAEQMQCNADTDKMVEYSVTALRAAGYAPYYLYRQKQMTGNLENIGWCKSGFLCVNNVSVMEEMLPVYACGAGAISKILQSDGKIARLANPKDTLLYLKEFEQRMAKKEAFYKNNA